MNRTTHNPQARLLQHTLTPLALAITLTACGGGGETGGGSGGGLAGIDGSGSPVDVTAGPISGFGSIFVNGRRYIVEGDTQILVDGISVSQGVLQTGQYVVILASEQDDDGNPIADEVISEVILRGPVAAIDTAAGEITALNQTIRISASTIFDDDFMPADLSGIAVNDIVEITGINNSNGIILASRIEKKSPTDDIKLAGIVANLDSVAETFDISGQTVNYTSASLNDLPGGSLSEGDFVKVEGLLNGGVLDATEVEGFDDRFDDLDDDEIEIKGLITDFSSASSFRVNGIPVTTDGDTEFDEGSAAALADGLIVEVEGQWQSGTLLAREISFEQEDSIHIAGQVESTNISNGSLNEGTLTVLGITMTARAGTSFEDDSDAEEAFFGLDDLASGDFVEIEGYQSGDQIIVTELERKDEDNNDLIIQGPVDSSLPNDRVTILGRNIFTTDGSHCPASDPTSYEDADENGLSANAFFTAATAGTLVKAKGCLVGGIFYADELSLEDED